MFEHLGGAGAGAAAGLDMVLMQQLRDQQMQEQMRAAKAREALAAQELTQRQLEQQSDAALRGRDLDQRDTARRDESNRFGVADMMKQREVMDAEDAGRAQDEALNSLPPHLRQLKDLFKIGAVGKPSLQDLETPEQRAQSAQAASQQELGQYEQKKRIDARYRDQGQPERDPLKDYEARKQIDAKYDKPAAKTAGANYAVDSATRVIGLVDAIEPRLNWKTTGVIGKGLSALPIQTDARDVAADIESLAGNIAYSELQKMRQASPTGGAIGQVSDFETKLLSGVIGSVRQDQSEANLRRNLTTIRESAARILEAAQKDAGTQGAIGDIRPMTSRDSGAAPAPKRMRFDAKGNPIP
jgi:hypothetical protein